MKSVAIIYLSNYKDWPMGGMLTYVKNLLPEIIKEEEWEVDIWGGKIIGERDNNYEVSNNEVQIYTSIKLGRKIIPNFIRSFFGILKHRKQFEKYDIIYSHTAATTIATKLCYPKKFVVHHQHGLSYKKNHGYIRILNVGYTLAQLLANVSFFVASDEELSEHKSNSFFSRKHFYAIGSPIDYENIVACEEPREETLRFIYTGRMDAWKNVELLINSFVIYHKLNPNSRLIMVGDGPEYNNLLSKVKAKKIDTFIQLLGRKNHSEIIKELKKSDIFLFPSKGEGVSLSILEALAAGLPVVAFNVIGVRNLVIPGKTGVIVKQMREKDFVDGICKVVKEKDSLKDTCVEFSRSYDAKNISCKIIEIIKKEYQKSNE